MCVINEVFELKQEHLKLLQASCYQWQDCETGAVEINPKRPYGNSYVVDDIAATLGIEADMEDDSGSYEYSDELCESLMQYHYDTQKAIEIVMQLQTFDVGVYRKVEVKYGCKWVRQY